MSSRPAQLPPLRLAAPCATVAAVADLPQLPPPAYPSPPPGVSVARNGAGRDDLTGEWVAPPGTYGPGSIPSQSVAARARWNKHFESRQRGVVEAVREALELGEDSEAMHDLASALAKADGHTVRQLWRDIVLGPKYQLRDRVFAYLQLGRVAGLPGMERVREEGEAGGITVRVGADAMSALLQIVGSAIVPGGLAGVRPEVALPADDDGSAG